MAFFCRGLLYQVVLPFYCTMLSGMSDFPTYLFFLQKKLELYLSGFTYLNRLKWNSNKSFVTFRIYDEPFKVVTAEGYEYRVIDNSELKSSGAR